MMAKRLPALPFKQAFNAFLAGRNARERRILAIGAVALALILIYLVALSPAIEGRANLEKGLPVLRQQAAELQAMAGEAATLSNAAAAPVTPMSKDALDTALSRKGLKAQSVVVTGEFAKMRFESVAFAGLADWLDEARRTMHLVVTDAAVTALPQTGNVDASLTVRQQKSDQ